MQQEPKPVGPEAMAALAVGKASVFEILDPQFEGSRDTCKSGHNSAIMGISFMAATHTRCECSGAPRRSGGRSMGGRSSGGFRTCCFRSALPRIHGRCGSAARSSTEGSGKASADEGARRAPRDRDDNVVLSPVPRPFLQRAQLSSLPITHADASATNRSPRWRRSVT
jgi:hypothetical protein